MAEKHSSQSGTKPKFEKLELNKENVAESAGKEAAELGGAIACRRVRPVRNLLLFAALAALTAIAAAPNAGLAARQSGAITPLANSGPAFAIVPLQVDDGGNAQAVNDAGDVVGTSVFLRLNGLNGSFATIWHNTQATFFAFDFTAESGAKAINASGVAVGQLESNSSGEQHAFLSKDPQNDTDVIDDLGLGPDSIANGVNAAGDVVGSALLPSPGGSLTEHAILWHNEQPNDLGNLGGNLAVANAIDDTAQVVGQSRRRDGKIHAFLWQHGKMRDLGTLGGSTSAAFAINSSGDVVGNSALKGDKDTHAFLWHKGKMHDLGGKNSGAFAINNTGEIAGVSVNPDGSRFAAFWQNGVLFDLNALAISPGNRHFDVATGINNLGQITANGPAPNAPDATLPYLLIQCPSDVSAQVQVTKDPLKPGIFPGRFTQTLHIRNTGKHDIAGPIYLVADNLPSGVGMRSDGLTTCAPPVGSPYVTLLGPLKHKHTLDVTLFFSNLGPHPITYDVRVLAGMGTP